MAIGEHKGKTTTEAKMEIKRELIRSGEALNYGDLTGKVVSRAGDECVVALTDHWIIDYGEIEWKMQTNKCVSERERRTVWKGGRREEEGRGKRGGS